MAHLAGAAAAVGVGAALQGSVGFGLALVSAPVLVLIDPRLVPGPILLCATVLTIAMMLREWEGVDLRGVGWAFVGRIPGTVAGAVLLAVASRAVLGMVLGAFVLVGTALTALTRAVPVNRPTLLLAGAMSGLMGTVAAIGGPPIALLYASSDGPRMRSTLSTFFTAGALMSAIALALVGRLGWSELVWGAALVPGTLLGFWASNALKRRLDDRVGRLAVLGVSALGGVLVIVDAAF